MAVARREAVGFATLFPTKVMHSEGGPGGAGGGGGCETGADVSF